MRNESNLKKLEIYFVGGVAAVLVAGITYALSGPFSPQDYGLTGASHQGSATSSSATSVDPQPALLEPALRSLDSVTHHG